MGTIKKAQFGRSVIRTKPCRPGECGPRVDKKATRELRRDTRQAERRMRRMKDGGKSFPDLNKDGKVTKADVLVGRGVIKAKKGAKMKAQEGTRMKVSLRPGQLKRLGRLTAKNPDKAEKVGSKMVERATRRQRGKEYLQKNVSKLLPQSKYGSKMKKARNGATLAPSKKSTSTNLASYKRVIGKSMRMGGTMKKCRGGCY